MSDKRLTLRQRYCRMNQLFWLALLLIQLLPDRRETDGFTLVMAGFTGGMGILLLLLSLRPKTAEAMQLFVDVTCVIHAFLIFYTLATAKLNLLRESMFPAPGLVLRQMAEDWFQILLNIGSSLGIILQGFTLGFLIAVPIGLFFGSSARFNKAAGYIAGFLASIPPVVYIPYGIALLPTFRAVSVFVIFLASFWPILVSTLSGVGHIERRILDSAHVLAVKKPTMLFRIILPASLPSIFNGMGIGLTISFILLTAAEMIGARSGMGWYVKYYSDLGNYTRTVVGVVVIGVVITVILWLFARLQKYLLRWRQ